MPEEYRKHRPYPGQYYRLKDAADANQLIVVRCATCRRMVRYLATDLITLLDPLTPADQLPYPCSQCGSAAWVSVKVHTPSLGDYGHLVVRRPGPVKRIQTWRTVRLGDEP
jgi:hypothetical protein